MKTKVGWQRPKMETAAIDIDVRPFRSKSATGKNYALVLCRFCLFFFLRLCVAIFLSFLFLPQGTFALLGFR